MLKFRKHFWVFFIVEVLLVLSMVFLNIKIISLDITKKGADGVVIADNMVRLIYKDDSIEEVSVEDVGLSSKDVKVGDCYHVFFSKKSGVFYTNMANKDYYEGVMNYRVEIAIALSILVFTIILRVIPEKEYDI